MSLKFLSSTCLKLFLLLNGNYLNNFEIFNTKNITPNIDTHWWQLVAITFAQKNSCKTSRSVWSNSSTSGRCDGFHFVQRSGERTTWLPRRAHATHAHMYIQLVPSVIKNISSRPKIFLGLFGFLCTHKINYSSREIPCIFYSLLQ